MVATADGKDAGRSREMSTTYWAYRSECKMHPEYCMGGCDNCRYATEPFDDEEWEDEE